MKTLKYIAMAAIAATMVSCDDFFDTESPSAMDDLVYESETQTEAVIAGIYNTFSEDKAYRNRLCAFIGENTDIEYSNKTGSYAELTTYNAKTSNAEFAQSTGKDPWGYLTSAVARAGVAIEGIENNSDLSKPVFQYYLGEAYFLRAFVTLEMVKIWGDVPVMSSVTRFDAEKVDRNVAYELIRSDLSKAIQYLPWSNECPGKANNNITRPSKAAAYALLARADLMYAGKAMRPDTWIKGGGASCSVQYNIADAGKRKEIYAEAMNACKAIIDQYGDSKLKGNFADVFKDLCSDNISFSGTEYIWVIPFADGARGQFMNYNTIKSTEAFKSLKNNESGSTNAVQSIVPTFVFDFDDADTRKWVTIAPFEWKANAGDGVSGDAEKNKVYFPDYDGTSKILYQSKLDIHKFYLGKYRVEWMSRNRNGNDDGVDFPIIRYADVLLMYAEAAIGSVEGNVPDGADNGLAQQCLDKVRARAGLSSVALNMDNIIKERAFELCGENVRKWDLMRWGIFKTQMMNTKARIIDLDKHQGEFAGTSDMIYIKYAKNDALLYGGADCASTHAYEIATIWGLSKNETEDKKPAGYVEEEWVPKNIFKNTGGTRYLNQDPAEGAVSYKLYENEDLLEKRFNWPIFLVNVSASDGLLWNDYDY